MLLGTLVGGAAQWLRTWALEPHGLRVCPGSGVTWSKLLDFFVPQLCIWSEERAAEGDLRILGNSTLLGFHGSKE